MCMKFECKSVGELLIVEAWNLTIILHPFVNTEASIIQLKGYSDVIGDEKLIVPNVKTISQTIVTPQTLHLKNIFVT